MRMTIEERERKFRATFESHNLDRFFAFAQDLMCDCSAADHAQTVWMDRERELKQRIKELEAERGTTPPEGLKAAVEAFIDHVTEGGELDEKAPFPGDCIGLASWVGGCAECLKRFEAMRAATQRAPVEQWRETHKHGQAAAPDHAREGALRCLVSHWRAESKRIRTLADRERSQRGQESLMAQSVRYWGCAAELERALADGKEGGE